MNKMILGKMVAGGKKVMLKADALISTRLLIQANSGGGKSYALRKILEQLPVNIPKLIIDPEGEFSTLREKGDYIIIAKDGGDMPLPKINHIKVFVREILNLRTSVVIDISELQKHDRELFVRLFCEGLMETPRKLWGPLIVAIDEVHNFCPEKSKSECGAAVIDLATRGRKRGFCLIAATQRMAKVNKDMAAELINKMVGRTGLDIDVRRAAEELGMPIKEAIKKLRGLPPGQFYVHGPALYIKPTLMQVGKVETTHAEPGNASVKPPAPSAKVKKVLAAIATLPEKAENELRTLAEKEAEITRLRRENKRLAKEGGGGIQRDGELQKLKADGLHYQKTIINAASKIEEIEKRVAAEVDIAESIAKLVKELAVVAGRKPSRLANQKPIVVSAPPKKKNIFKPVALEAQGEVTAPQQKVLSALAMAEGLKMMAVSRPTLGAFAGYKSSGGSFNNILGALRTMGYLEYPQKGMIAFTDEGRNITEVITITPSLEDIASMWMELMTNPQKKVFKAIVENGRGYVADRGEIAAAVGYEAKGGSFNNILGALRTMGAIVYPSSGMLAASEYVFPEGVE